MSPEPRAVSVASVVLVSKAYVARGCVKLKGLSNHIGWNCVTARGNPGQLCPNAFKNFAVHRV